MNRPLLIALALALIPAHSHATAPDFHADIAPLLRDYCLGCHNAQDKEGGLSLDTFADLMRGGESGPAIVPGNAADSYLIRTLTKQDKPAMPPKKEPQPSAADIALMQTWVNAGAPGPAPEKDLSLRATLIVPEIAPAHQLDQPVAALALSPDGKQLAVSRHDRVQLLDAASLQPQRELAGHPGPVNAIHYAKDGTRLLTASGVPGIRGSAHLWDLTTGTLIREFGEGSRDIFYDAEFSPDETLVATAGYDRAVTLWDASTGQRRHHIEVHNGAVFDLAFSPDGKVLASASADQTLKLWNTATGERLDTLNQPEGGQHSVLFTPDGKFILAAGADKKIRKWHLLSVDKPRLNPLVHTRFAHEDDIVRLALSPDGSRLVSSSADFTLKLWSLPDLDHLHTLDNQPDLAPALALAANLTLFSGRMDGSLAQLHFPALQEPPQTAQPQPKPPPAITDSAIRHPPTELQEIEPNDTPAQAQPIVFNSHVTGAIPTPGDIDIFRFTAQAGQEWVFEINAAQSGSALDSKLEILHPDGRPVEQVVLQAVRDSWFTFRGKDSTQEGDFRLHNWMEMELNDYLYASGEVVKLWRYPRGPDSGFLVYPGTGHRHTFFHTTGLSHALGEPCYIVRPLPPGSQPSPNGLPVFTLFYENDDDPARRLGKDSFLLFTAPRDGDFLLRLSDVRGHGGPDYTYSLAARPRTEDFKLTLSTGKKLSVSPGSGSEISFSVERFDDFQGEVHIDITNLPPGFTATTPVIIEASQKTAVTCLYADPDAKAPTKAQSEAVQITASATIRGQKVTHEVGNLGPIILGPPPKVRIEILADGVSGSPRQQPGGPLELTIHPGETISAIVRADRSGGLTGEIPFGKEDSGRNLPFGTFVDNIGLSGLIILANADERQFFITAGPKWLPETSRLFHLHTTADGGQATRPVLLHIRRPDGIAGR